MAEQESRIDLLRSRVKNQKSEETTTTTSSSNSNNEHVNFFSDVEAGKYISQHENVEHVKEKKEEQEKYEKQIGYLTYLGQDTNELDGKRNWYDTYPSNRRKIDDDGNKVEVNLKAKLLIDPMSVMQKYLGYEKSVKKEEVKVESTTVVPKYESVIANMTKEKHSKKSKKKKSKKHKKDKKRKSGSSRKRRRETSSESSDDEIKQNLKRQKLEQLRVERLKREQIERDKAEKLLAKLRGEPEVVEEKPQDIRPIKQKYNSQFNPEIARQNTAD